MSFVRSVAKDQPGIGGSSCARSTGPLCFWKQEVRRAHHPIDALVVHFLSLTGAVEYRRDAEVAIIGAFGRRTASSGFMAN